MPVLVLVGGLTDLPVYLEGLDELVAALSAQRVDLAGQRHIAMAGDPQGFAAALRCARTSPGAEVRSLLR